MFTGLLQNRLVEGDIAPGQNARVTPPGFNLDATLPAFKNRNANEIAGAPVGHKGF